MSIASSNADQVFIFNVKGKAGTESAGIDLTVTVVGNDSVTITKLPTGSYTVMSSCRQRSPARWKKPLKAA